jgi:dephospho-CoA kinase
MTRIAFVGPMGSGKTTAAEYLVKQGFTRVGFADAVKDIAAEVMEAFDAALGFGGPVWDRDRINENKGTPGIRKLLQVVGTDIGRELYGDDVWINKLLSELDPDTSYVIDDVRFPNEAQALRESGFTIVRIDRDPDDRTHYLASNYGVEKVAELLEHPSERAQMDIIADWTISNRGGKNELLGQVDDALQKLDHGAPVE